jgi:hypothetical protein
MKKVIIEFSESETATLYALAGAVAMKAGLSREEAKSHICSLSPPNLIRYVIGLPIRRRGGARPNTNNRYPKPS